MEEINIVRSNIKDDSYERVREKIMTILNSVQDPDNPQKKIIKWIKPREELYTGSYLEKYPDLVFELDSDYGAGWDPAGSLFDVSRSHSLYPGSHMASNAVFFYHGPDQEKILHPPES